VKKIIKSEESAKKIMKFLMLWVSSFWLNILVTFLFRDILNFSSNFSYFITIFILMIYQFLLSLRIIFKIEFSFRILFKYLLVLFSFSIVNYVLVIYLKNNFWEEYFYIIIIWIVTILSIIKFIIYNNIVFNKDIKW